MQGVQNERIRALQSMERIEYLKRLLSCIQLQDGGREVGRFWQLRCCSHTSNLLAHDLLDEEIEKKK